MIKLRAVSLTDLDDMVQMLNDSQVVSYLSDHIAEPYTQANALEYITQAQEDYPMNAAIDFDGQFVGCIGLVPQEDIYRINYEIGYWLASEFKGKGIVSEAVRQMVNYAFTNPNIFRVFANIIAENTASQKVLIKNHFRKEAFLKENVIKRGVIYNSCIYAITREEWVQHKNHYLVENSYIKL